MKISTTGVGCMLAFVLGLFAAFPLAAQNHFGPKEPTSLRASVSFVWLSDFDSQGVMFSNRLHHYVGDRFGIGLNAGLLSSSRYDKVKEIYTIKNAYYMAGLDASFDVLQNESVAFRIGAGPAVRRRSEITTDFESGGTQDGSVTHNRTTDVGFNAFVENDFGILRSGVAGGRVEYLYYTDGTPVLAVGLHVGFKF